MVLVFWRAGVPIAKYDKTISGFEHLNNQFTLNISASFKINSLLYKKKGNLNRSNCLFFMYLYLTTNQI
jgi:hypothetical protein